MHVTIRKDVRGYLQEFSHLKCLILLQFLRQAARTCAPTSVSLLYITLSNRVTSVQNWPASSDICTWSISSLHFIRFSTNVWIFYVCCRLTPTVWERTCVGGQQLDSLPLRQKSHYYRDWKQHRKKEGSEIQWVYSMCQGIMSCGCWRCICVCVIP